MLPLSLSLVSSALKRFAPLLLLLPRRTERGEDDDDDERRPEGVVEIDAAKPAGAFGDNRRVVRKEKSVFVIVVGWLLLLLTETKHATRQILLVLFGDNQRQGQGNRVFFLEEKRARHVLHALR